MTTLADDEVGSLEPEGDLADDGFLIRLRAPAGSRPEVQVLQNLTTIWDLRDLALLSAGALDGGPRGTDAGGFALEDGAVRAWDGGGTSVTLGRQAFTRALSRLVDSALEQLGERDLAGTEQLPALAEALRAAVDERST